MTDEKEQSSATEVSRVAVKVPQFWKENPIIWFSQVESQFITSGITQDSTKYHTIVASIETDVLAQVSDIITSPPATEMYDTLKNRLVEIFTDSEERRLKKLLQDIDLGDKRPSILLRQMQDLAGNRVGENLLKSLWLQRLPTQMQAILTTSSDDLSKLAVMADKIADVTYLSDINAISAKPEVTEVRELKATISDLQSQISELTNKFEKFSHLHRGRSNSRSRNKPRERSRSRGKFCWYHFRFRERATRCRSPCSFKSEN